MDWLKAPFPVYLPNNNDAFLLPSYLLCTSAHLYCNISSRTASANHHHPLSSVGMCIFIFPAVKTPARKCCMSWRDRGGATDQRKITLSCKNVQIRVNRLTILLHQFL